MEHGTHNLLRNLPEPEPSAELLPRILRSVAAAEARRARVRFALSSAAAALSLVLLVPAVNLVAGELAASGFLSYLSLAFSDSATVLASWNSFALVLAAALPVAGLLLAFSSLLALLSSLVAAARQLPRAFPGRLIHS